MEKDRGRRNKKTGEREENTRFHWPTQIEQYPEGGIRIWLKIGDKLYRKPYTEELLHRRQIRQSSTKQSLGENLSKVVERTLKNGEEIIVKELRRVGEVFRIIKPRQKK